MRTISEFLRTQAAALRRIAGATRGDMSVEDVKQEAWLVAADIEQRRGYPVDFGDPGDQESLLKWLYCKLVRFAEKQMRHAVRIDKDWDREDAEVAASALARLLTSPLESDPLVRLQQARRAEDIRLWIENRSGAVWTSKPTHASLADVGFHSQSLFQ